MKSRGAADKELQRAVLRRATPDLSSSGSEDGDSYVTADDIDEEEEEEEEEDASDRSLSLSPAPPTGGVAPNLVESVNLPDNISGGEERSRAPPQMFSPLIAQLAVVRDLCYVREASS